MNAHEEALVRGWIEQLPYPTLASLYLDGADALAVRTAVAELRERLARKARLSRRPELQAFWVDGPPPRTVVDRDDPDEEDGPPPLNPLAHWQKRARIALDQLIRLPEPTPQIDDPVGLWVSARVANVLKRAGFDTLRDVHIAAQKPSWWTAYPGVGPGSGRAVLRLFKSMGADPAAKALPAHPTDLGKRRPLVRAQEPGDPLLNGSQGENRERQRRCRIEATNDYEAIHAWLSLLDPTGGTYRNYRREAERLLLWCLRDRRKAFSSLSTPDCADYLKFLQAPAAEWVGTYGAARGTEQWKPFRQRRDRQSGEPKQGLSAASQQLARTVLNALCDWLETQAYLAANPFRGLPKPKAPKRRRVQHTLSLPQWQGLLAYCRQQSEQATSPLNQEKYRRLEFILCLAYETGLRLSELASARWGDIAADTGADGSQQWWLKVVGKGHKAREVPLSRGLMEQIEAQREARGYGRSEPRDPQSPLIGRARRKAIGPPEDPTFIDAPLTESGLHHLLTQFFREASAALQDTLPAQSAPLAEATAHWLRHTYASHAVANGVPLDVLRENLGHEDLATTSVYVRSGRDRQYQETTGKHRAKPD